MLSQYFLKIFTPDELKEEKTFKPQSQLKKLLNECFPRQYYKKRIFYIEGVLSSIFDIIDSEPQYDATNSFMLIFNTDLTRALGMAVCSIDQLPLLVSHHLIPRHEANRVPRQLKHSPIRFMPHISKSRVPGLCILDRTPSVPFSDPFSDTKLYKPCDDFIQLTKPLYPHIKYHYEAYTTWFQLLITYLRSRESRFIHKSNPTVYMIANDPLGKILNIQSFHRDQTPAIFKLLIVSDIDMPNTSKRPTAVQSDAVGT